MNKLEQYKARAAECLALAQRTKNQEEKTRLLKMAEAWKMLAGERHSRWADNDE